MKYIYTSILVFIILLAGCVQQPTTPKEPTVPAQESAGQEQVCTEMWVCQDEKTRAYRNSDCTFEEAVDCPAGCENGECKEVITQEDIEKDIKEEIKEELQPAQEQPKQNENEQIQQILGYAKTKISSYSYQYKDPLHSQYIIYVKGNKMRIDYVSSNYKIYIDTEKKTAEKWCISHPDCGKQTGKMADLDYNAAYIETPIDWLPKITEAKKIDEGVYYGKNSWSLDTNIGAVTIDSNFGFIYYIQQKDKEYSFTEAAFNTVTDSEVTIPEYLTGG